MASYTFNFMLFDFIIKIVTGEGMIATRSHRSF